MTEAAPARILLRLLTWFSPAFPTGGFAWSHGLETAVAEGRVGDRDALEAWIADLLELGGGWNDAVLFVQAHCAASKGDLAALREVADLALALAPSRERRAETAEQGRAFLLAAAAWPCPLPQGFGGGRVAYPVAAAAVTARQGVAVEQALLSFLHAFVANQVSAAIRLVPLGQQDGLTALRNLEPLVLDVGERALAAGLDDLGGAAFLADIASMRHETQPVRLFRS